MDHSTATVGEIHFIHNYEYANRAALLAATQASGDIGKVFRVTDEDAYYICKTSGSPGTFLTLSNKEIAKTTTADATATEAYAYTMADNSRIFLETYILCMEEDGTNGNAYIIRGLFKREGAGAVQQGTTSAVYTEEEDAAWSVEYAVSGNDVQCKVTGAASTDVIWITETKLIHTI